MFLLFLGISILNTISGCSLNTLPTTVQTCWHEDFGNLPITLEHFPNGAKCMAVEDNAVLQIVCDNMDWTNFGSPNNPSSVSIYNRKRRDIYDDLAKVLGIRRGLLPDIESPSINCSHEHGKSTPIQTHGKVSWKEPIAYDNTDGVITPVRFGREPNSIFNEGITEVVYQAKDRSGNIATCTTYIHMDVARCTPPTDIPNGYYMCHPSTDFVYGGSCTFGCYDGFELNGKSEINCTEYGQWTYAQPNCIAWKCPPAPFIDGAIISCTNENNFRSICTYSCAAGFSMPPAVSSVIVCSVERTWRMYGQPKCIDIEPPLILCPDIKIFGTDTGINTSVVHWTVPKVYDNNDEDLQPTQKLGPQSYSSLIAGTYDIEYGAKDKQGNEARACSFKVIVRDVRCPKLYVTPYMELDCPQGYRTGAECYISCNPGTVLADGSNKVQCVGISTKLYGEWQWRDGFQPLCKHTHVCQTLFPPKNGAVVCDNWTGGQFCQFQCTKGTTMASVDWKQLHACSKNGDWLPEPIVKPCIGVRRSQRSLGVEASFYLFSGQCTDFETKTEITTNFIRVVKDSLYQKELCPNSRECSPQNVQVRCGESNKLRRDAEEDTQKNIVTISAYLHEFIGMENASFVDLHRTFMSIYNHFEEIVIKNASDIINGTVSLRFVKNTGLEINCPEGSVKSEQYLNCVDCPEGTFFQNSTNSCEFCGKGTYQNSTAQTFCIACPFGKSTRDIGSTTIDYCEDACSPGFFSDTGILPCSPCETGYYQSSYGKTSCNECHGTTTTLKVGSSSFDDCKEFDIVLPHSGEKTITVYLESPRLLREFVVSFWIQFFSLIDYEYLSLTFFDDKTNREWSCTILTGINRTNGETWNTTNEGFVMALPDPGWHHVIVSNIFPSTELYLDKQFILSRSYAIGRREFSVSRVEITAGENFSGAVSQLHVWSKRDINNITSKCWSDISGDILSWQQFGDSVIDQAFLQMPSICDDFNNCVSSPCLNGKCMDAIDGYECECNIGYLGKECNINIDDCAINVCMEGSTCIDGVDNYTCICPQDTTGLFCEIKMVHGQWSEWTRWTDCSHTCGDGEQNRRRLCNSPNPDNGGNYCSGFSEEIRTCNLTVCPSCPNMTAPENGTISCDSENDTIVCSISCNDGFDFDIEPLKSYFCGPKTFHIWNFETDVNPLRKLPKCTKITAADKILVHYSAKYRDLHCENIDIERVTKEKVDQTLDDIARTTSCFTSSNCRLENVSISGCQSTERHRREPSRVGFSLTLTMSSSNGEMDQLGKLQNALNKIQVAAETSKFVVNISQTEYDVDLNLTTLSGDVKCPNGTTRVYYYCVPCGSGSFLWIDYCKPCPKESYQDQIGQMRCKRCRFGRTTLGEGSTTESECSVVKVEKVTDEVNSISVALGVAVPILTVFVVILLYKRIKFTCQTVKITSHGLKQTTSDGNDGILAENQKYTMNTAF